jgi:hypothetical protein
MNQLFADAKISPQAPRATRQPSIGQPASRTIAARSAARPTPPTTTVGRSAFGSSATPGASPPATTAAIPPAT